MKGDASLFAAIDLGSNAFRMMIGQSVRRRQGFVIQEVKTLREPVRLAEGFEGGALDELALDRGKSYAASRPVECGRWRPVPCAKPTMPNCSWPAPSATWGFGLT